MVKIPLLGVASLEVNRIVRDIRPFNPCVEGSIPPRLILHEDTLSSCFFAPCLVHLSQLRRCTQGRETGEPLPLDLPVGLVTGAVDTDPADES